VNAAQVAIARGQDCGCGREGLGCQTRVFLCGLQFLATESASIQNRSRERVTPQEEFFRNSTRSLPLLVLYPMFERQPEKVFK
jgi:hypothetical protein